MALPRLPIHLCILPIAIGFALSSAASEPKIIGWIENVQIAGLNFPIKAKIDTGAKTNSLGVLKIDPFNKNGKEWARFSIQGPMPEQIMLERPILRWTKIRRAGSQIQRRPVIILPTCLGGYFKQAQFTLEKREGMNYSVLIGRRFLDDKFLVTASKTDLSQPRCTGKPEPHSPDKRP